MSRQLNTSTRIFTGEQWFVIFLLAVLAPTPVHDGCTPCLPPLNVRLRTYNCENSPCSNYIDAESSLYQLSYSLDGSEFSECSGQECGESASGCGGEAGQGEYTIRAERAGKSWKTKVLGNVNGCTMNNVELIVEDPPPPKKCLPAIENLQPVEGNLTWSIGSFSTACSFPAGDPSPFVGYSRSDSEDAIEFDATIFFSGPNWNFSYVFSLGDPRAWAREETRLLIQPEDIDFTVSYGALCPTACCCTGRGSKSGVVLLIEEAAGEPAPWPAMVTNDFQRRFRLSFQVDDAQSDPTVINYCYFCDQPLIMEFSATFELKAENFVLNDDGTCLKQ